MFVAGGMLNGDDARESLCSHTLTCGGILDLRCEETMFSFFETQ